MAPAVSGRIVAGKDITELMDRWGARTVQCPEATICAGPEFQCAVMTAFGGTDPERVAVVEDDAGDIQAIWPFVSLPLTKGRVVVHEIGFARNAHTLRNTFLAKPCRKVVACLLSTVLAATKSDTVLLQNMQGPDGMADLVRSAAQEIGLSALPVRDGRVFDFAEMPEGFEVYLATRSGQFRRQIRKRRRELEALGAFRIERLQGDSLSEGFASWRHVVDHSWQGQGESALKDADWAFHRALSGNGVLWLAWLNDRPIAALRMLEQTGRLQVHTMHFDQAFRQQAPGVTVFAEMMRDAAGRGVSYVDFNGHSDFFARWATGQSTSWTVRLCRPTLRGQAVRVAIWAQGALSA